MNIETLLKENGARIIDVRTPMEFSGGHVADSVNIPLNEISDRLSEITNTTGPVILCCASGMRSQQATGFLQSQGLSNVFNGGSWLDVNYYKNK